MDFYICDHCKNVVTYQTNKGVPIVCCGEKMHKLVPGSVDAAQEKHVPVVEQDGQTVRVQVGSVIHPMTPEHLIEWIILETNLGYHRRTLTAQDDPQAQFQLAEGEVPAAVYEYCNLHGLWMTQL